MQTALHGIYNHSTAVCIVMMLCLDWRWPAPLSLVLNSCARMRLDAFGCPWIALGHLIRRCVLEGLPGSSVGLPCPVLSCALLRLLYCHILMHAVSCHVMALVLSWMYSATGCLPLSPDACVEAHGAISTAGGGACVQMLLGCQHLLCCHDLCQAVARHDGHILHAK